MPQSQRVLGTLLTALGVLWISPEALLLYISKAAPALTVMAWRYGVYGAIVAIGLTVLRHEGPSLGLTLGGGWALSACGACFILAVRTTAPANALVIMSSSALWASLWARAILGDPMPYRTLCASAFCAVGIGLVVVDGLSVPQGGLGEALALGAAATLGLYFVCGRIARVRHGKDLMWSVPVGCAISGSVCTGAALLSPDSAPGFPWMEAPALAAVLTLATVVLPPAITIVTIGPSLIPAADCALLMLLETVFGSLWVALYRGKAPSVPTMVGAAITLGTLAWHTVREEEEEGEGEEGGGADGGLQRRHSTSLLAGEITATYASL
eukprot:TRINITY_DN15748_c0_g1_i1.p1 TRINITY_DN15748_c0_g1~~TRINITY_DN15748_c0_g1_i1.p1  ORF type:complete len:326 (+),score=83.99 TRINITY_DN15748_c0_g1_i1:82-1059(+)